MQGTIATFSEHDHDGSLFLDDGTLLAFGPAAFAASGLRLLRSGQRVRVERSPDGDITLVTLVTLGTPTSNQDPEFTSRSS